MSRAEEYEKVVNTIKENKEEYCCGIFFSRNLVGDFMTNIFKGEHYSIDVCDNWAYFEVFGCTEEEEEELTDIYEGKLKLAEVAQ